MEGLRGPRVTQTGHSGVVQFTIGFCLDVQDRVGLRGRVFRMQVWDLTEELDGNGRM